MRRVPEPVFCTRTLSTLKEGDGNRMAEAPEMVWPAAFHTISPLYTEPVLKVSMVDVVPVTWMVDPSWKLAAGMVPPFRCQLSEEPLKNRRYTDELLVKSAPV